MSQHYQFKFKKEIARFHLEEGRTFRNLAEESEFQKDMRTPRISAIRL